MQQNFIQQQSQQLEIFNQIIDAYTKTNKKFADENALLKEDISRLTLHQNAAITALTDIGRDFHANLTSAK